MIKVEDVNFNEHLGETMTPELQEQIKEELKPIGWFPKFIMAGNMETCDFISNRAKFYYGRDTNKIGYVSRG